MEEEKSRQKYKLLFTTCGLVQEQLEGMQIFATEMGEASLGDLLEDVIATNTIFLEVGFVS